MIKYKNYYIDGIYFRSKQEIDDFIRNKMLEKYKMYVEMFAEKASMELNAIMCDLADKLVNQFDFTYDEIEQIEIDALEDLA